MADTSEVPKDEIAFYLNGRKVVERHADPEMTLLYYIRNKLYVRGTKQGCDEGGCGACTVMLSKYDHKSNAISHSAVTACLTPLCSVDGMAVTTVEGISSTHTRLHPVQERLAKSHGTQCGFCSPGMVMSMYTLLRNNPQPSEKELKQALQGNLCRCTGYRPILDGFKTFTKEFCCGRKEGKCCMDNEDQINQSQTGNQSTCKLFDDENVSPLDPTQEPIFPPELMLPNVTPSRSLFIKGSHVTWIRPAGMDELLGMKFKYPDAKLIVGNTAIGLETKFKRESYPVRIDVARIPELNVFEEKEDGIIIGSSVTIATMRRYLEDTTHRHPEHKTRTVAALLEVCRRYGGEQIRNMASIGGSVARASATSDLNSVFMAAKCTAKVTSLKGEKRDISLDEHFFIGKGRTSLTTDDLLLSVWIPFSREDEFIFTFKQSRRRDMDTAIVNACMRVRLDLSDSCQIKDCCLSYGGMAPTTVMARNTAKALIGKLWDASIVELAGPLLKQDLPLRDNVPGGQAEYRHALVLGFFFKFYLMVTEKLQAQQKSVQSIPENHRSAASNMQGLSSKGVQTFQDVSLNQPEFDAIGRPLAHLTAREHTTGEALYCNDIPHYENELYVGLVLSDCAHARIKSIDTSEALQMPGVHCYVDSRDVPGSNMYGAIVPDDQVFYDKEVTSKGQVIGAIVGDDKAQAQRAANAVKIEYDKLPAIVTIEEAIQANSFFKPEPAKTLNVGDIEVGFGSSDHVICGEIKTGAQDHFYMEPNVTIAVPKAEENEMEVISSSQNVEFLQSTIANILGFPSNRIVAKVKRLGGGFGGKQVRFVIPASVVAVAAKKTGRPVRCALERNEDMKIAGMRSPYFVKYKVGFTKDGKIQAIDVAIYSDAGYSNDLSFSIMDYAFSSMSNVYHIRNIRAKGYVCQTNLPSNTAYRGYGKPQMTVFLESVMNEIAAKCGISQRQVREENFLRKGDMMLYNQPVTEDNLHRVWEEMLRKSDYEHRCDRVAQFNRVNRWRKRGIAVAPALMGMAFDTQFLNQAGALVHVYKDGSVLLTHGGIEMGQGLHTKMVQVAARVLNIPVSRIFLSETSTNTVPNATVTAASVTADMNGMAVKNACETIRARIAPFKQENPGGKWEDWVFAAYFSRVSLSATGFYSTPGLTYDPKTNQGVLFSYYAYAAGCTEVEVDCLTGDHQVLRTDIVFDAGKSLNPAIDIGQIEGAFVQGQGMVTLEDVRFSEDGTLLTTGPGTYKIPGFTDIPAEFNVHFLENSTNDKAIYSSKGVGEISLSLASSVLLAIKNAIASARLDAGVEEEFRFDSPATCERIRMACTDRFIQT